MLSYWKYIVMAALAAALGLQTLHVSMLKTDIAKTAAATANAITAGLKVKIDTDEQTRLRNEENDRNHQMELDHLRGNLVDLDSTRVSNSPELAPIVISARKACASSPSAPKQTGDPIGVLTDVLGRIESREEVYARTADERRIAGIDCERRYDALP